MTKTNSNSLSFSSALIIAAVIGSFKKLDPRGLIRNPVIFVTACGATLCTISLIQLLLQGQASLFVVQISFWLWITVLFANFAESLAEGRGKAQAESMRKTRSHTQARRLKGNKEEIIIATELLLGDLVVCETGDVIPSDGEVIEGVASVDESAITGESAPVVRESGGDRSAVTGGTRVLSDRLVIKITCKPGDTFLDRMISLVEGASRQKTPNEIALTILLSALTLIFLLAVGTLYSFGLYAEDATGKASGLLSVPIFISLLVCLIPTTIGGLLSAIGISGMDRMIRKNVIATSGKAVEVAGDIDVLMLDKTGTITLGNRMASDFIPASNVTEEELADAAQLSSLADETPEGRSIVILAKEKFNIRGRDITKLAATFVPFSANTRMSGVDLHATEGNPREIRKGATDAIKGHVISLGGIFPDDVLTAVEKVAGSGGTPLVVSDGPRVLGVVALKDVVKDGIKERFKQLRAMGIRTIMITGDNPITAAAIAAEADVDDFIAEARPESKLQRIRDEQAAGRLVAMIGDGTNDAPALAQADVGVAMNTGTQAAREASNMVDLDSNPTKLIDIVETGKQLLITRGALTTFSIANDVAKYFAILPAIFSGLYLIQGQEGPLSALNLMGLSTPQNAILSAVIFNALIIVFLVPLAMKGVGYKPMSAEALLRKNLFVYGLGGLIVPFIGIKLIDIILVGLGVS